MAEPNKQDKEITTQVNAEEASYLQSLGLKTLLSQKLTKPVKRFWQDLLNVNSKAWPSVTLFFVLLFTVSAIVLTLSANVPHDVGKCETCEQAHAKEARQLMDGELPATDRAKMLLIALAKKSDINQQNILGQTILHQAIGSGCGLSTFDFLIAQGADLNARAYGRNADGKRDKNILGLTPVMAALFLGKQKAHNYEIALHLITRHSDKIDFTIETKEGMTLVMIACKLLESDPDNDLLNSIVRVVEERKKKDI